ncbi:hypothetical protein HZU73_07516 [Apis mellifera caucasica]|uniref:Uncharacterized protein LOC100577689 n=1 Tax=Apis mellifera TaxID=7460 RepID=A0A7M7GBB2_APIME|nr:uncharacterized protein LOC100577689 [Apis mellifera]KAG6797130.1 hypothetical protein HZU73_07516 [Apis mellifera caucasica]KAG9438108.1 hypothetical protein HZU67_01118 [Apis mellifera carnica]|eukprot:XP_003251728.1 uncharacterized protein LOC100577689 [Apis mellifera]
MEEQSILTSKSYKRAETNLKDKLKLAFLKRYPHYLVPGHNLHTNFSVDDSDLENVIEQYQEYPYHCDLPKPLLPPAKLSRNVLNEEDPTLELVILKNYMNKDIERMKHYYLKHEKDLKLIYKKDVKWNHMKDIITAKIPKYVADLAQVIDKDPDPYFKGAYNWYYTGGSMNHINLHNKDILLFPFMGELVSTPLDNIEEFLWKPLFKKAAKCELNGSLYELKHNVNVDICMILGRYKQHCNFYILSERDNKCNLTEVHTQISKIPYISADLNPLNANQYCLVDVNRCVTLWDMTKMKPTNSNTILNTTVLDDSWSSIKFQSIDPNVLLFVDRCCLHYLDIRVPFDRPTLTICPKFYLEKCEYLSLDVASKNNFCRYIGTYHSVLMCDNRSPQKSVQQKWIHQFKGPPLIGSVINREDKEFVVLSSQIAGETTIIVNTWTTNEISHSYNFPYTPPHIKETLNESQIQGMCLNPYLRDRFELSNTGSFIIKDINQNIFLFLQNSIGDIYYQCLTHDTALDKYSFINGKSCCLLNAWENAVSVQIDTIVPLTISNKLNVENFFKSFTNKKLQLKNHIHNSTNCFEPSWKQSFEKLNTYMDILAPELLAMWEICEEVPLPLTTAPHQKVLSWLESADPKAPILSQEEMENISTPINSQELISVSQEMEITYLDDSNALQDLLPKVKTTHLKKGSIRKKRKV